MRLKLHKWIGGISTEQNCWGSVVTISTESILYMDEPLGRGFGTTLHLLNGQSLHVQEGSENITAMQSEPEYAI